MRILTLTVLLGLPLMALGQTEPQQPTQEQTKETQTTAPAKGKKMRPAQEQTKPQAKPFRLIGNTYFVFVDNCWVAVDVDGFVYTERVICAGDPDFIEVE